MYITVLAVYIYQISCIDTTGAVDHGQSLKCLQTRTLVCESEHSDSVIKNKPLIFLKFHLPFLLFILFSLLLQSLLPVSRHEFIWGKYERKIKGSTISKLIVPTLQTIVKKKNFIKTGHKQIKTHQNCLCQSSHCFNNHRLLLGAHQSSSCPLKVQHDNIWKGTLQRLFC